ncbi:MAG: DUF4136 domain-containing protein [Gammaproteobacteria bacterium]|nr:DUF4136 domain-containing protein [Gammaproteobacteria bacterium]
MNPSRSSGLMAWSVVVAVAGLAACSTLQVGSDFDRTADVTGYKTFAWMPREHYGTKNPLIVQRTKDSIQSVLTSKGLTYVDDGTKADFLVDFTIGAHDRTDIRSYPAPYADFGWWGRPGWWGYSYWGDQVDVRQYREGILSIDMFDVRSHRPVWHGWAKKELSEGDSEHSEASIRTAVAAVLETFPRK